MKKLIISLIAISLSIGCSKEELNQIQPVLIAPIVTTTNPTDVTLKSATLTASIEHIPYSPTLEKGFIYSENLDNLNWSSNVVKLDSNATSFNSNIKKLIPNKTYYYKAYAKNKNGVSLGGIKDFTTGDYIVPTLSTDTISNISLKSIQLSAEITDDGETPILSRGFCISTNPTPTIVDTTIKVGDGMGKYTIVVTKLKPNTKYYVRSFATNSKGTAYGNERITTTLNYILPQIKTGEVTNVGLDLATLNGNLIDFGRGDLLEMGVCVSKTKNPTIDNIKVKSSSTEIGTYKIVLTKLDVSTKYYVRVYTLHEGGIVYGNEVEFTTDSYTTPKVSTNDLQNISFTSLRAGVDVQSEGNTKVTDKGVVISTNQIPDLSDLKIQMGDGIGGDMKDITGLVSNVTYYLRGYATNKWGTSYGDIRKFTTKDNTPPPPPAYVAPISQPNQPSVGGSTPPTNQPIYTPPIVVTPPPLVSNLPEYVNVPDRAFEQALISRGFDFVLDGRIATSRVVNVTEILIVNNEGVNSIVGIEAFFNLQKIRVDHNNLTNADFSKNKNLTFISVWDNKLNNLDVSQNIKLQTLVICDNNINQMDVSKNINLIEASFNNTEGKAGYGTTKGLTSVDFSHNKRLKRIYLGTNRLTNLDISQITDLEEVWAEHNKIVSLDGSNNPNLNIIVMWDNNLSYLNAKTSPRADNLRTIVTIQNPNLKDILVTNLQKTLEWQTKHPGWMDIDSWTRFVQ